MQSDWRLSCVWLSLVDKRADFSRRNSRPCVNCSRTMNIMRSKWDVVIGNHILGDCCDVSRRISFFWRICCRVRRHDMCGPQYKLHVPSQNITYRQLTVSSTIRRVTLLVFNFVSGGMFYLLVVEGLMFWCLMLSYVLRWIHQIEQKRERAIFALHESCRTRNLTSDKPCTCRYRCAARHLSEISKFSDFKIISCLLVECTFY